MSVRERLQDAEVLYKAGQRQGALLSVLVAVAASSRKRFSRSEEPSDKVAFTKWLQEEMGVVTGGGGWNYFVHFRGKEMRLEHVLYTFVRCELTHEGTLPSDIAFDPNIPDGMLQLKIENDTLTISDTWVTCLSTAIRFAPENATDFPEVDEMPDEVKLWFMFGKRREHQHVKEYWNRRKERVAG